MLQSNGKCAKMFALIQKYDMGLIILAKQVTKRRHHLWRWLIGIVVVIALALFAAGMGLLGDRFFLAVPAVGIAAAVTLFLLVGSFFLSVKIYEKKEF